MNCDSRAALPDECWQEVRGQVLVQIVAATGELLVIPVFAQPLELDQEERIGRSRRLGASRL